MHSEDREGVTRSIEAQTEKPTEEKSESEFLDTIKGMRLEKVLPVIGELMTILKSSNKKLHDDIIRKLKE